jgi:hypothetical protein
MDGYTFLITTLRPLRRPDKDSRRSHPLGVRLPNPPILARISAIDAEMAGHTAPARPAQEQHVHD